MLNLMQIAAIEIKSKLDDNPILSLYPPRVGFTEDRVHISIESGTPQEEIEAIRQVLRNHKVLGVDYCVGFDIMPSEKRH